MIQCERIDKNDSIDFNKSKEFKECMICHYCYFSDGLNINLIFVIDVTILM